MPQEEFSFLLNSRFSFCTCRGIGLSGETVWSAGRVLALCWHLVCARRSLKILGSEMHLSPGRTDNRSRSPR